MPTGLTADGVTLEIVLGKKCRYCDIELTSINAVKRGKTQYRNFCKKCRSTIDYKKLRSNPARVESRRIYVNSYLRKIGKVKQYPCEICNTLCYKKYKQAFCSDKCRFMSYVEKTDSCWLWRGGKNRRGYGKFGIGHKTIIASRYSYEIYKGKITENMLICHTCDNPPCVNPDHLWQGTNSDNIRDSFKKCRSVIRKGEENSNAKLTEKNVLEIRELFKNNHKVKDIACNYDITTNYCRAICMRTTWKHI